MTADGSSREDAVAHVLIADDDRSLREVVRFALERDGHRVTEARDGAEALAAWESGGADLLVLDVVMPNVDGLAVCRQVRATSTVPIVFLSSRDEELDRILGLELGGDDYVTKPFSPRELATRVKVLLRRVAMDARPAAASDVLEHGEARLDVAAHRCWWRGVEVTLTATEFGILTALLRQPGRAFSRQQLVDAAWGPGHAVSDRTVDSHVRRIRSKLAAELIATVHGVGYRLG